MFFILVDIYHLDNVPNNVDTKKKYIRKSRSTGTNKPVSKYERFTPHDRSLHNAKERACRERIASLFAILSKCCTYLDSTRRCPSKHSILAAAKKECKVLVEFEQQLLAEKEQMRKTNEMLKTKLRKFS